VCCHNVRCTRMSCNDHFRTRLSAAI
jgi:hypothetical protein